MSMATGCAIYVNILLTWICIFTVETSARVYHKRDFNRNNTSFVENNGFAQKKPRSAQYGGFLPRLQAVYPRQGVPVRLATIPTSRGYPLRLSQRLANVAPLTRFPALQRTYVPVISSMPSLRYPLLRQGGLARQYVIPYTLKMPSQGLTATPQVNEGFEKHYSEKYNTLPATPDIDLGQGGLSMPRKTEVKKVDIGDDFDNFLASLDGPCSKNPCKNGAKCHVARDGTSFHCICKRGYKGKTCEAKNECFPNPCQNNGECTLTSDGFECSCPKEYKGKKCEQKNTCEPNPCQHDGICTELKNGGFECTCKKGYFGEKCQVGKLGCSRNPCRNNGHCVEKDNGGYECVCPEGYSGTNCAKANNKCFNSPCKNGGSCMQAMTSLGYECACARGFRGRNCEDHSGCDVMSCQNGGTCYETEFGVRCICRNGYSGDKCQIRKFCEADTCENNGKCIEHVHGFRCVCPQGYKGKLCDEIDRCRPNPCLHGGRCEQSENGYFCKCLAQYQGRNCEVSNPCSRNPCKNGGKCSSGLDGQQYQCECLEGYRGPNCEERNVCMPNPCENNGACRSTGAGFVCECRDGFQGKTCSDKDPCRENPCMNNGVCKREGNHDFTCSCPDEYKGTRCEVKRHCSPNPCMNQGICEESENDFVCLCKHGFRGQRCEEQDQCAQNPCKNGGRCVSVGLHGNGRAFVCECANSFYGDTCEERNPCHPNPCGNEGQCTEINGGFTCQCRAGYKGDRCREIDKCNPNPCQHQGSCSEVVGGLGYACKCPAGYKGQDCERKDYCHPNPCDHDGQCEPVNTEAGFQCKCAPGYMGQRCSELNPCEPNPCLHNSHCILLPGFGKNHECNCSIGWSGDVCQKREICQPNPCQFGTKCVETGDDSYSCVKSMCHPNPCQNSGKCINVNQNNYKCACTADYQGKTCEVPRKHSQLSVVPPSPPSIYSPQSPITPAGTATSLQLAKSPARITAPGLKSERPPNIPMSAIASCSPMLCQNEGVCVQEAGKPIRCKCPPMFTGETCEINKCKNNPCKNNSTCIPVDREPGFVCKCADGLTGPLCSRKPCEPNPCLNDGQCVMFYSIYLCKCKTGFRGKLCEETTDGRIVTSTPKQTPKKMPPPSPPKSKLIMKTDQARSPCNPNPCKNNAQCMETPDGEFECICSEEFSGPRCEDDGQYKYSSARKFFPGPNEECRHCDKNARCVNGHCVCKNKYVGDGLECWERTMKDENWSCAVDPCKNGGTCKEGRSGCVCRLGFVGDFCEEFSPPVVHLTFDKMPQGNRLADMSGYGNDALINQGFKIEQKRGKCDSAGNLMGGDIIFDGEHFQGIPRRAITIAVWVKVVTALGIQSIFDTVGSHSRHKDGQYHFEIDDGRVRWFHRNEDRETVFSVVTDQIVVREGNWTLITGTYSADKNRARIYVNGDLMKEAKGRKMLLSGDWGAKAGIGKHEHPYGARILRGMVDEFSIFPSELPRLQILVLMTHCKVYYNQNNVNKKTSKAFKESFTEMRPNTAASYTQTAAGTYTPSGYQTQANYDQSPNTPTIPQPSSNVPATYNYQTAPNVGQGYPSNNYYGNNRYQPSATREQTGYQRSQGFKQPSRPNTSRYTTSGPYVPKQPSYAQGVSRAGIPAGAYQPLNTPTSTYAYSVTPGSSYRVSQGNRGYPKSYTTQSPVTPPYSSQWSREDQVGYARTQTPSIPRVSSYNTQYQQNTEYYNGYATMPNQQQNQYNPQGAISTGTGIQPTESYVPQTESTSQETGYARNGVYSLVTTNAMPYQEGPSNAGGDRYSTIPARIKSFVPQNSYQTGNQNEQWRNDVTSQMTLPSDVRSVPYTNDLQSSTRNAYPRNNVYPTNNNNYWANNGYNPTVYAQVNNLNPAETPVTRQYASPYDTQSISPQYGTNYAYSAGSGVYRNIVRGNIPRPKSPSVKQESRTARVTKQQQMQNLRTMQGLIHGPSQNKNKPSRANKLDANGQFPSDMKKYQNLAQMNARKSTTQAQSAGISSSSYAGVKQPAYPRNGARWSARTRTPTRWSSGTVAKTGSYDSWSAGMQAQKPENLWNTGPVSKVDEAVKYNNDVTTMTSQPTPTNTGNKAATKGIDMDNVVNKAFTDFLTMHILRKRKRRKRENELTQTLQRNKRI